MDKVKILKAKERIQKKHTDWVQKTIMELIKEDLEFSSSLALYLMSDVLLDGVGIQTEIFLNALDDQGYDENAKNEVTVAIFNIIEKFKARLVEMLGLEINDEGGFYIPVPSSYIKANVDNEEWVKEFEKKALFKKEDIEKYLEKKELKTNGTRNKR